MEADGEGVLRETTRRIVERFTPERVVLFGSRAGGQSFALDDLGERALKGFKAPVRVYAVVWE
jgi:class 3 adenylate cyclase